MLLSFHLILSAKYKMPVISENIIFVLENERNFTLNILI